jgi:hypothetical protein
LASPIPVQQILAYLNGHDAGVNGYLQQLAGLGC